MAGSAPIGSIVRGAVLVALILSTGCAGAYPPLTSSAGDDRTVAAQAVVYPRTSCPDGVVEPTRVDVAAADVRYTLHLSGEVIYEADSPWLTFRIAPGPSHATDDGEHPAAPPRTAAMSIALQQGDADPRTVACGPVVEGQAYAIPVSENVPENALVVVRVWGAVVHPGEVAALQRQRAAVGATLRDLEVAAARRLVLGPIDERPSVSQLIEELLTTRRRADEPGAREALLQAIGRAERELQSAQRSQCGDANGRASRDVNAGLKAACRELATLAETLEEVEETVPQTRQSATRAEALARLRQHREGLRPPDAPAAEPLERHCEAVELLEWYARGSALLATYELPAMPPSRLLDVEYAAGSERKDIEPSSGPVALLIHATPSDQEIVARLRNTGRPATTTAKQLATFVIWAARGLLRTEGVDAVPDPEPKPKPPTFLECAEASSEGIRGARPLAARRSRAFVLDGRDPARSGEVVVCAGSECTLTGDDANVVNTIELPARRAPVTLALELSASVALTGGGPIDALGNDRFVSVGQGGPDQAFELARDVEPDDVAALSLLLVWRTWERIWLGIGPTLLGGNDDAALAQWNARVIWSVGGGLLLTTGPAVRIVSRARGYALGDRVAVPVPATGEPQPPAFGEDGEVVGLWSLGLALDLEALVDGGEAVLDEIGGD